LQNRFIPFQFAITFCKIFGSLLETALTTRSLIRSIQFEEVSNQRNPETYSHFSYNEAQQTPKCNLCSVIKKRCCKHWKFNQRLKSQHRIQVILESEDRNTIPAQEETRSQIVIKETRLFEATKKRSNNLAKLYRALLAHKRTSVEPERASSAIGLICHKTQKLTEW